MDYGYANSCRRQKRIFRSDRDRTRCGCAGAVFTLVRAWWRLPAHVCERKPSRPAAGGGPTNLTLDFLSLTTRKGLV
jgi:hypothetical protein